MSEWTEAADGLCSAVENRIEATARQAAESLYEGLLYDTQTYLRENVGYNLKAELDRLGRENERLRQAATYFASLLPIGRDDAPDSHVMAFYLTMGELRQARALAKGEDRNG